MTIDPTVASRFARLRWMIYVILVLAYMTAFFHRMAPGVVSAELMAAFQTSGAALGSLAAMYYYIYTAMQIPAGVLADTLGPRVGVAIGCLVAGAGSVLFGLAETFEIASAGRLLVGLGVSVIFVGLMRSNTLWFSERVYGAISGLTLLLGNLGAILAAGPLALALQATSWRNVFVGIGLFSGLIALLSILFVRSRPEDAGLPSVQELEGRQPHPPRARHWLLDLRGVLTTGAVWPSFFVMFGVTGSLLAFAGLWGVPLMRDSFGLDRTAASLYTTVALSGFAIGCLAMGALSDRLGRRKPVIVGASALSLLLWLALTLLPWGPGWSGLLLYGLLGLVAGGFVVGYAVAKEVVAPGVAGMSIALVNTGLFLGAAIMQPAFGWAMDLTWDGALADGVRVYALADYRNGLWLSAGFAGVGLIAALFVRETRCRNITLSA
ncbi:MFS transporter [Allochromatium vinosum]|uniref:Lysosomal dipeptide transporter MFSD1 n=1 Tax=Allochromatium vinosum (strain ATCC 17899 / DSM 180 / NBRC 103801 / NCIMB 10441 / D) TaxID=572477 RepID=D3RQV1_ALLVD|nr:MFS transporter [Allochromatium vinosum]ADC63785.1 major facilitator superfamily MFS_1 [Allochromatium vinosum DSM 180]